MTIEERLERLEVILTEIAVILMCENGSIDDKEKAKKDIEDKIKIHNKQKHIWS